MKEFIEREAAIRESVSVYTKAFGSIEVVPLDAIASIPAADVVPAVRGKWEEIDRAPIFEGMGEHSTYRCSSCRAYQFYDVFDDGTARYNFCPNCGADMREES